MDLELIAMILLWNETTMSDLSYNCATLMSSRWTVTKLNMDLTKAYKVYPGKFDEMSNKNHHHAKLPLTISYIWYDNLVSPGFNVYDVSGIYTSSDLVMDEDSSS